MVPHPARIACLDLDTFFVSVERLLDPSLVGREVVVGGTGWRGVVTSCSYEVRARGVRSGMSLAEARRLAPDAEYVAGTHGVYAEHSRAMVSSRVAPSRPAMAWPAFRMRLTRTWVALRSSARTRTGRATTTRVLTPRSTSEHRRRADSARSTASTVVRRPTGLDTRARSAATRPR